MKDRAKASLVIGLILLPLVITMVFKYAPAFLPAAHISSVTIVPPTVYGEPEFAYLAEDVPNRLRKDLATIPGLRILRSPTAAEVAAAVGDPSKLAVNVNADAVIMTAITVDAGLIQLSLEVIDAGNHRSIYNTPYESSRERYPDMMKAAGAALKQVLSGNAN